MKIRTLLVFACFSFFLSCKKNSKDNSNTSNNQQTELSEPFVNSTFGYAYQYDAMCSRPLTILKSGELALSTIQWTDSVDKLKILLLDAIGRKIWEQDINSGKAYEYKSGTCFETSTGDIIVLGSIRRGFSWTGTKCLIAKLNRSSGAIIWLREYGYNYQDRAVVGYEDLDQNYWIADVSPHQAIATLIKIASNGDSLTCVKIPGIMNSRNQDLFFTKGKKLVAAGKLGSVNNDRYFEQYTNGVQDFSSVFSFTASEGQPIQKIEESSDGGYFVVGNNSVIKFNNQGNVVQNKVVNAYVRSCAEKKADFVYLGTGCDASNNLYTYDFNNLNSVDPKMVSSSCDAQLLRNGSKLYRVLYDITPNYFRTIRLVGYNINN